MGKFSNTWSLMRASWEILKEEKQLLVFPLISGFCCLIVLATFALPLIASGAHRPSDAMAGGRVVFYATLFLFYFCNYFVIVFFSSAMISCAMVRIDGGNPTVGDGLRAAASCLPLIAGWALISATVGLILRIIEDRSERLGQIVAALLGMAWTVSSFLVIPILVLEKKDPVTALRDSAALLKKTWGEQIIGNFSFGLAFLLLSIPGLALIVLGVLGGGVGILVAIPLAVLYITVLILIQSALQAIFQTALYLYARSGRVSPGFQQELLTNAIMRK